MKILVLPDNLKNICSNFIHLIRVDFPHVYKIYAVNKVCTSLLEILSFFSFISCLMQIENNFISHETFFAKSQDRFNRYRLNSYVFIIQVKKSKRNLDFLLKKKFFAGLLTK